VERAVKERLVGAAVLMAVAIILIPEMLSGPDREPVSNAPANAGEAPIKTYTIDLNQGPGSPPAPELPSGTDDTRAPPPEEPATTGSSPTDTSEGGANQGMPESTPPAAAPGPNPSVAATDPSGSAPTTSSPAVEPPAPAVSDPAPAAPPLASTRSAPKSGAWAVQLGSFSKQATAERLARDLSGQGQDAFVMPVKSGSGTLYRVRIGPMKDRASAEATLRKVKATMPGAAIVPHP
jgi:DedD protein